MGSPAMEVAVTCEVGMSIAAKIVSALSTGNQTQSNIEERPYDRVRGACYSKPLGLAIKRLRADGDPRVENIRDVFQKLRAVVIERSAKARAFAVEGLTEDRNRLCLMAIMEWLKPHCTTCRGAGEMWERPDERDKGRMLAKCETCEGSGVKRYSDRERAQALNREMTQRDQDVMRDALNHLYDSEVATEVAADRALNHGIPEAYLRVVPT